MTTQKLTDKAKRAIAKYGQTTCEQAFEMTKTGDRARTIGYSLDLTTNQADAAIEAGRELANLAPLATRASIKDGDQVAVKATSIKACQECGSADVAWQTTNVARSGIQQGRLNTSDVECLFILGCNHCSETLATVTADKLADIMNDGSA